MPTDEKYLQLRNQIWWYVRRVPSGLWQELGRKFNRYSLKTTKLSIAQARRDMAAAADNDFWAELLSGDRRDSVMVNYERVILRAQNLNVEYKIIDDIINGMEIDGILERLQMIEGGGFEKSKIGASAVLGLAGRPAHKLSAVFDVYLDKIMATVIKNKNDAQRHRWIISHKRIINNFIAVVGDVALSDITRENTLKYKAHFQARVLSNDPKLRLSAGAANREIGTMQTIYTRYHKHFAFEMESNPFADLKFAAVKSVPRPFFTNEWILRLLASPALTQNLNVEARAIVFAMVETGMRPIEICNVRAETIFLEGANPYVSVEPREASADEPVGYELKTQSSARKIPLVGVSFEAFKVIKRGLGRYGAKNGVFSSTVNKFFRDNGLMESGKHSIYSFRHSFKERMVEGGIDLEMRDILMGHSTDKPEYGAGGSMEFRSKLLKKIVFDFDIDILK